MGISAVGVKLLMKETLKRPLGVQSAKAVGTYCVAAGSTVPKEMLRSSDKIMGKLIEFNPLVLE